jgi:hypothetical protein
VNSDPLAFACADHPPSMNCETVPAPLREVDKPSIQNAGVTAIAFAFTESA